MRGNHKMLENIERTEFCIFVSFHTCLCFFWNNYFVSTGYEPTIFKARYLFIRIHRKFKGQSGYFHTLRTIQHRTPDEARGRILLDKTRPNDNTYLLLAECEVRTASYAPSFFPFFLWPKHAGHENKEGKKRGSITCRTDRANEANKIVIIWLCWLFPERNKMIWRFKRWSRSRGPLRTRNWPITARDISQPYNKIQYSEIQNKTKLCNTIQYSTIQ